MMPATPSGKHRRGGPGDGAPGPARRLHLTERVAVVAEKHLVVGDDHHAHQVEPDRAVIGSLAVGKVGDRNPLEGVAIDLLLGKALASVTADLAVNEDQVALVPGDEVDGVAAVRSTLFQDFEALALEERLDAAHRLDLDCLHD